MNDQQAIERYRYLLRTAPPDDIERAHEEAFAQLSPEQRAAVLRQLSEQVPASELGGDDPKSLARAATRAENARAGNDGANLRRGRCARSRLDVPLDAGRRLHRFVHRQL